MLRGRKRARANPTSAGGEIGAALLAILALAGCSSLSMERTSESSGTFRATGIAFTILSIDLPKGAQMIARENASDANLPNMEVAETTVTPYLGPFDFLLDILSVRWAKVEGTWGYAPSGGTGSAVEEPAAVSGPRQ